MFSKNEKKYIRNNICDAKDGTISFMVTKDSVIHKKCLREVESYTGETVFTVTAFNFINFKSCYVSSIEMPCINYYESSLRVIAVLSGKVKITLLYDYVEVDSIFSKMFPNLSIELSYINNLYKYVVSNK